MAIHCTPIVRKGFYFYFYQNLLTAELKLRNWNWKIDVFQVSHTKAFIFMKIIKTAVIDNSILPISIVIFIFILKLSSGIFTPHDILLDV